MASPQTHYARRYDIHIGYQVWGGSGDSGAVDILELSPGLMISIDETDNEPSWLRYTERLAGFSRLIRFDHRGTGLSDPLTLTDQPILEAGAKDMLALLDACGSERAVVVANGCVLKGWTQRQPRTPVMVSSSRGSVEGVR